MPDLKIMRRSIIVALALLSAASFAAEDSRLLEAAKRLDGNWQGNGFVLRVDIQRAQASIDPNRPFEWQRFMVKEVTPDEIVFTIGAELFEARVAEDTLTLSGTNFRGRRYLWREGPLKLRP
jgi:hypothetical protein